MRSWIDLVGQSDYLASLYDDTVPSLRGVDMHEIGLHRDGPNLSLRFDLPDFPKRVPAEWKEKGFNVLQIHLLMVGLRSVVLSGWATEVSGTLRIEPDETVGVRVLFDSRSISLGATAPHLTLAKLSPYTIKPQY